MKILRLKADGFGPLRGEFLFDPERLTLIVDENGRGKTSLLAAIAAALYGLERDQRSHRHVTPIDRWRPWDGGSHRVELEVEHAGERFEIRRDFTAQVVSVWDERGRDRTEEFREGKGDYPVGKALLGLDALEFEKCAFFRHGELDQVVPDREPDRRESTLLARLECAADTRAGDTNAIEAERVLEKAAARYECPEASANPISLDIAIRRLDLKDKTLETELAALDRQKQDLRGPLEEIAAALAAERAGRTRLADLERERRSARTAEIAERLREDDERRTELGALYVEAEALRAEPRIDAAAESELRECRGRLEVAERHALEIGERHAAARATLDELTTEWNALAAFHAHDATVADRLAAAAQQLRSLANELDRARTEIESLPASDAHPTAAEDGSRFESLAGEDLELVRDHAGAMLGFQERAVAAASRKNDAMAEATALDARRRRAEVPGWILLGLGVIAGLVAAAAWYLESIWIPELIAGLALIGLGIFLLTRAEDRVRDPRDAALATTDAAEAELARVRTEQIARQERLRVLAMRLGFTEGAALLEAWVRHRAWIELRRPLEPIEKQRARVEQSRAELITGVQALLGAAADVTPDGLDSAASRIRRTASVRERLATAEAEARRLEHDGARNARVIAETRKRAQALLAAGGLEVRAELPLDSQIEPAWAAASRGARLAHIESELAPQLARMLLDERARAALERECAVLTAEMASDSEVGDRTSHPDAATSRRALAEIDAEIGALRAEIDGLQERRSGDLARFEERALRIQDEIAAKSAERDAVLVALERARRFQGALQLARETIDQVAWETHRHWAAFLNRRVGEIVRAIDTDIADVRFGEDLDFSIKLPTGLQVPRGKGLKQLSSGARDQLHFAVRIAIGEFLSKGAAPLPLLIDECFATSDDERARAGLRLLIEHVSRTHQVILVTCHRKRHEALAELDGALWRERVHWIDARPAQVDSPVS